MRTLTLLGGLLGLATSVAAALPPVHAFGNKFFTADGKQFFIKGVAYQLVPTDPLVDTEQCARDAALMKTLGVNTIRVYHVEPTTDHDGCMEAFDRNGIYATIDLDTFNSYILPNTPYWNQTQVDHYTAVMDVFHKYDNVLGFYVGNEIIAINNQSNSAPFIKAAVRDIKKHRDAKGYRKIPIGYSATDIAELRPMLQDYLTCGGDESVNIDFFGLNSYQWCDPSTYETSGYVNLQKMADRFPVPIFFTETGCNVPGPRLFEDQSAIFTPPMADTWSGAIIYEWIQETNNYGLISYAAPLAPTATGPNIEDGFVRKGTPTPRLPDFDNLKKQWATLSPKGVSSKDYKPDVSTRPCPASTEGGWLVNGNVAVPTVGATFTGGAFSTAPSVTGSPKPTSTQGAAPAGHRVEGTAGALVAVMLAFTWWL